jgi:hypothetical protein
MEELKELLIERHYSLLIVDGLDAIEPTIGPRQRSWLSNYLSNYLWARRGTGKTALLRGGLDQVEERHRSPGPRFVRSTSDDYRLSAGEAAQLNDIDVTLARLGEGIARLRDEMVELRDRLRQVPAV